MKIKTHYTDRNGQHAVPEMLRNRTITIGSVIARHDDYCEDKNCDGTAFCGLALSEEVREMKDAAERIGIEVEMNDMGDLVIGDIAKKRETKYA